MPSSPSLATFLAETDASKEDASHTKTVSAEIEVSMEVSISTGKINEVSSPKADTVTGSAPSVVNTDSVCGFALEEVQVDEVQVEGVQVEGVQVEEVGVGKAEEQMRQPFLSSLRNMPTEEEARSSVAPVIHNALPDETLNVSLAVHHMPTEEAQKNEDSMQATKMNEPGDTTKLDTVGALESFENAEVGEEKELKKGLQVSGKPEAEIEEKENEEKNLVSEGVEGQTFENPESEQKNGTSENFATVSDVTVASSTVTTLEGTGLTDSITVELVDESVIVKKPSDCIDETDNSISEHSNSMSLTLVVDNIKLVNATEMATNSTCFTTFEDKTEINSCTDVSINSITEPSNCTFTEFFDHNSEASKNPNVAVVDDGGRPSRSVADRSSEDIKEEGDSQEELNQELEAMEIPPHWHPKPCVHISCIGGSMTEEV